MSSFFDEASLVMIPSGYKDQKVYSVKPLDGSGDLTFSRASSATRVASNGLIEKVRTNLILQSNTFSTTWTQPNTTVTSGQADPDGGTNAWLVTETVDGGSLRQSVTATGSLTFSMTLKANTGTTSATLFCTDASQQAAFDLSAGNFSASGATAKMVSLGNGWWRCSISFVASGASTLILFPSSGAAVGSTFAYQAQLETGDIATDYIATTSAAVSVGPVSGLPRLDYLNSSCPRLLLEPQRTNLMLYSEQFNNSSYVKVRATITANAITSPDGYTNADKIESTATGSLAVECYQTITTTAQTYTASAFFKLGSGATVMNQLDVYYLGTGTYNASVKINLSTGVLTQTVGTGASVVNYGNGWYRVLVPFTASDGTTAVYFGSDGQHYPSGSYTYVYGAQVEAGAYATSYIPTLGTSVTRVADAIDESISGISTASAGTFFLDFERGLTSVTSRDASTDGFFYRSGTGFPSANSIEIASDTDGSVRFAKRVNSVFAAMYTNNTLNRYKMLVKWNGTTAKAYVNGTQVFSGALVWSTDLTYVGYNADFRKSVNQLLIFPTEISDSQAIELTTL
jgi:hypothetical protein